MSKQLLAGFGTLVLLSLAACQGGDALGPSANQVSSRREAETRGTGGKRNDDGLTVKPTSGKGREAEPGDDRGGHREAEPGDDRGRDRNKNDDPQPHS